jgi:hypothetical protein
MLLVLVASAPEARASGPAATPAVKTSSGSGGTTISPADRAKAAAAYDRGLRLFDAARYQEAARAFVEADQLVPNSEVLSSAMAAARKANEHLLVLEIAERALAREASDPKLAGAARAALSEAEAHLARVELGCEPAPCSLMIEGEQADGGRHYLLPGTHLFTATYAPPTERVDQRASLEAGSLYRISLVARRAPPVQGEASRAPVRPVPNAAVQPQARLAPETPGRKPLKPWQLYAAGGVTIVLGGITVWSGLDALSRVDHYKATRASGDRSSARESIRRTDWLLVGTALAAAVSTFAAVRLVDFGPDKPTVSVVAAPAGALLCWSGRL